MYDLKNDPNELNNIYDNPKFLSIRERLISELFELKDYYGDSDEAFPELFKLTRQYSGRN
jgi:uncharacterized sulfatase